MLKKTLLLIIFANLMVGCAHKIDTTPTEEISNYIERGVSFYLINEGAANRLFPKGKFSPETCQKIDGYCIQPSIKVALCGDALLETDEWQGTDPYYTCAYLLYKMGKKVI